MRECEGRESERRYRAREEVEWERSESLSGHQDILRRIKVLAVNDRPILTTELMHMTT